MGSACDLYVLAGESNLGVCGRGQSEVRKGLIKKANIVKGDGGNRIYQDDAGDESDYILICEGTDALTGRRSQQSKRKGEGSDTTTSRLRATEGLPVYHRNETAERSTLKGILEEANEDNQCHSSKSAIVRLRLGCRDLSALGRIHQHVCPYRWTTAQSPDNIGRLVYNTLSSSEPIIQHPRASPFITQVQPPHSMFQAMSRGVQVATPTVQTGCPPVEMTQLSLRALLCPIEGGRQHS